MSLSIFALFNVARRKQRRFPEGLDPAAVGDPFAGLSFCDALFHIREKIFPRVRPFEIQIHLALTNSEDVAMRIGHAGHDCVTAQIDNACFGSAKFCGVLV